MTYDRAELKKKTISLVHGVTYLAVLLRYFHFIRPDLAYSVPDYELGYPGFGS